MKLELIATATFGLEAVVRREIEKLGYDVIKTEDGKVTFAGNEMAIVRSNLWLRCADRVLLKMGEFMAYEFEDLFQQIKGIEWEKLIPMDGKVIVTGTSVKSKLHSVPACQSVANKAVFARLEDFYGVSEFPETGPVYKIKVSLLRDRVTVTVDTSGDGLHKRGYRVCDVAAPIKETLAAALVDLSFYNKDRLLVDWCCGSGTIPIEAAMIARNMAPGLQRKFVSETWDFIKPELWKEGRKEAYSAIDYDAELRIHAMDIDGETIKAAMENAEEAGVDDAIVFERRDMATYKAEDINGVVVCNPPYGQRIGEAEEIKKIYKAIKSFYAENPSWSLFMITTDEKVEDILGRKANRRRKLFNGHLKTCYYQFHGERIKELKKRKKSSL